MSTSKVCLVHFCVLCGHANHLPSALLIFDNTTSTGCANANCIDELNIRF